MIQVDFWCSESLHANTEHEVEIPLLHDGSINAIAMRTVARWGLDEDMSGSQERYEAHRVEPLAVQAGCVLHAEVMCTGCGTSWALPV